MKEDEYSFSGWLFSKQEALEKTVGLIILLAEIYLFTGDLTHMEDSKRLLLTYILNFFFLLFVFFILKSYFKKRYSVSNSETIKSILRLPENKIMNLVSHANTFIRQLKNFNYFVLSTALIYLSLIIKYNVGDKENLETDTLFHFLFDSFSYLSAFFLLRCFFVMYLPTIDKNGNDILNKKTSVFIGVLAVLLVVDVLIMRNYQQNGFFLSEFICGLMLSVVFILFTARFENKILDIPPFILLILYIYAIMQTCLPFVTGNFMQTVKKDPSLKLFLDFLQNFGNFVLIICLIGKITLASVILYVLNTRRIFYYFITLRTIHEEQEENWQKFQREINEFSVEPEKFVIYYNTDEQSNYTATIPNLFDEVGKGTTADEAKENLIKRIKHTNRKNQDISKY